MGSAWLPRRARPPRITHAAAQKPGSERRNEPKPRMCVFSRSPAGPEKITVSNLVLQPRAGEGGPGAAPPDTLELSTPFPRGDEGAFLSGLRAEGAGLGPHVAATLRPRKCGRADRQGRWPGANGPPIPTAEAGPWLPAAAWPGVALRAAAACWFRDAAHKHGFGERLLWPNPEPSLRGSPLRSQPERRVSVNGGPRVCLQDTRPQQSPPRPPPAPLLTEGCAARSGTSRRTGRAGGAAEALSLLGLTRGAEARPGGPRSDLAPAGATQGHPTIRGGTQPQRPGAQPASARGHLRGDRGNRRRPGAHVPRSLESRGSGNPGGRRGPGCHKRGQTCGPAAGAEPRRGPDRTPECSLELL